MTVLQTAKAHFIHREAFARLLQPFERLFAIGRGIQQRF